MAVRVKPISSCPKRSLDHALGIANVPPATIAADYALSNRYLAPVLDTLQRHAVQAGYGMPRDGWLLEARPETMLNTLAYLDRRYGGVGGYVRRIGLEEEQLRRLRARLVE